MSRPSAQSCVYVGSAVDMALPVQHHEAFPRMLGGRAWAHLLGPGELLTPVFLCIVTSLGVAPVPSQSHEK